MSAQPEQGRVIADSPFVLLATRTGKVTHLGVRSPIVAWHEPAMLPAFTLCARLAVGFAPGHVADVGCLSCLYAAPKYMGWPAFTGTTR